MSQHPRSFTHDDYTIGLICALAETELVATSAMLDEEHPMLAAEPGDSNAYCLGRMGHHNVVIACLPAGYTGKVSAAVVAKDMLRTFKAVRFGLMVGIGGGVPLQQNTDECSSEAGSEEDSEDDEVEAYNLSDVRLGDVVVSLQSKSSDAVVQYDFGKSEQGGIFVRTGKLNNPPQILLSAVSTIQAQHKKRGHSLLAHLSKMIEEYPNLTNEFASPGPRKDRAFKSTAAHIEGKKHCKTCCGPLDINLVQRKPRETESPVVHYGTVGSADRVMKNSELRNKWAMEQGILCFEMEAAGLVDTFPCLVIRGICDYADSHKNKIWQPYAAATAAAYAKEFLGYVSPQAVLQQSTVLEGFDAIEKGLSQIGNSIREQTHKQEFRHASEENRIIHQAFKSSTYEDFKNNNPTRVEGTCKWVLQHPQFTQWLENRNDDLVWISADPGCGKSVLARSLVEHELRSTASLSTCYFFFKDNEEQHNLATALCAVLHQLFGMQDQLLCHAKTAVERNGEKLQVEVGALWGILKDAATDECSHDVICVLDALDECQEGDRAVLLKLLSDFYKQSGKRSPRKSSLKFLVTSRPYRDIESGFREWIPSNLPAIRLSGEEENDQIHTEINLVIHQKVATLARNCNLDPETTTSLKERLLKMENRTYLWLHLAIKGIETALEDAFWPESESIDSLILPTSVQDAYEKILDKIAANYKETVRTIFHIIIGAHRPLTTGEMAVALSVAHRPNMRTYKPIKQSQLERLLRHQCGLFVFINHTKIYFIHRTAKEFLLLREASNSSGDWKHSLNPNDSEALMARVCVDHLLLETFDNMDATGAMVGGINASAEVYESSASYASQAAGFLMRVLEDKEAIAEIPHVNVLLGYSARHWPAHVRDSNVTNDVFVRILELYRVDHNRFQIWFPLLYVQEQGSGDPSDIQINSLRLAAFNGHIDVLKSFLDMKNIDIDASDNRGATALHWATIRGHEAIVALLLETGANTNQDGADYSALTEASLEGFEAIVKMLLEHGADVNHNTQRQGKFLGTALQAAAAHGHIAVVEMLLEHGADVNAEGGYYGSALQAAAWHGREPVVKVFLQHGADVNAQNGYYGNALQAASWHGHELIVNDLLRHGADMNLQGGAYGNSLRAASYQGQELIVGVLLKSGADVNISDDKHDSALEAALLQGHKRIVELLLQQENYVHDQASGTYAHVLQDALAEGNNALVDDLIGGDDALVGMLLEQFSSADAIERALNEGDETIINLLLNEEVEQDEELQAALYQSLKQA